MRVPLVRVLIAIKLFELDTSVREAGHQLDLSYNTVYDLFDLFRQSIVGMDGESSFILYGEIEMDESYFGGTRKGNRRRGAAGKIPVFGILERGRKVRVKVVQNVTGETLLTMAIKKVKRGSLIYTDKFRSYNGLFSYGFRHMRIDHGKRFVKGEVYINGIEEFWSFAKERLMKYHGVNPKKVPFYLKELEFRYNHRHHALLDDISVGLPDGAVMEVWGSDKIIVWMHDSSA
ncbi:MAG: IS1595 family transposase [Methanoregula sp.]|nr:IS1595 family transposase [Methanoregula sp.]